jgi:hypothetical protein
MGAVATVLALAVTLAAIRARLTAPPRAALPLCPNGRSRLL